MQQQERYEETACGGRRRASKVNHGELEREAFSFQVHRKIDLDGFYSRQRRVVFDCVFLTEIGIPGFSKVFAGGNLRVQISGEYVTMGHGFLIPVVSSIPLPCAGPQHVSTALRASLISAPKALPLECHEHVVGGLGCLSLDHLRGVMAMRRG